MKIRRLKVMNFGHEILQYSCVDGWREFIKEWPCIKCGKVNQYCSLDNNGMFHLARVIDAITNKKVYPYELTDKELIIK